MEFPFITTLETEEQTAGLAADFISELRRGDKVVLNGSLGAGKTFFIKKALEKIGINSVNSPTFAIVNEYNGLYKIYHFDFYRINDAKELFDIGFNDYMNDEDAVAFIEWGELFNEMLPPERIEISIVLNEDYSRRFHFSKLG